MTEFDVALDFLQSYVKAASEAAERGGSIDDRREFLDFCGGLGIEPAEQRRELVQDLAGVVKECIALDDEAESYMIPASRLAEGLEQHGWRLAFLNQDATA